MNQSIQRSRQRLLTLQKLEAREAGLLYMSQQPYRFTQVLLSAFLLSQVAEIAYTTRYSLYQRKYFESDVEIPLRKKFEVSNLEFLGCSAGYSH